MQNLSLPWGSITELCNKVTRRGNSSPFIFRHDNNAIKLQGSLLFVSLVEDIRAHLLNAKHTRAVYVEVADRFFHSLHPDVQALFTKPTDKDFYNYIFLNWPTFSSFNAVTPNQVTWGIVRKGDLEPNEINILSSIVESADTASTACDPNLAVDLNKLVLTVIILHELSHAFTKFYFKGIITLHGVGAAEDLESKFGESGWQVEEKIMEGRLAVEWVNQLNFGNMDEINQVILMKGSESFIVDNDAAKKLVSSLKGPILSLPLTLKPHKKLTGSAQARVTESTANPMPEPETRTSIGLGFTSSPQVGEGLGGGPVISLVGHDRF